MYMLKKTYLFVLIVLSCSQGWGLFIPPVNTYNASCESYLTVLTETIVQYAAGYLSDKPQKSKSSFDPNLVNPLTPITLFNEYYGDNATPEFLKQAILRLYYSDPGPSPDPTDRILLRNSIYRHVKANSLPIARQLFGELLYLGIDDYAHNSPAWKNSRCFDNKNLKEDAENVITVELERLRNEIGEFKISAFLELGAGTTLAFVIDDTGSMADEITAAKTRAKLIINSREGSLDQPSDFLLVPFNDPVAGPVTKTSNEEVFKNAINRLYAHGGGDAAELTLSGILLALQNSRQGSTIFVITDTDAKDVELQNEVVALAKLKDIKITFLLTDHVRTTMCKYYSRSDNALENKRCETPSFKRGYSLYQYIASSSGGNVLVVSDKDIFRATEVVESTIKHGVVEVEYQVLTSGTKVFPIQIDSSITEIFLQFSGGCNDVVFTYNGTRQDILDVSVVEKRLDGRLEVDGQYGEWLVSVSVNGNCTTKVLGRSSFGFIQHLAKEADSANAKSKQLQIFEGQPLISTDVIGLLDSYGRDPGDKVTSVSLISSKTGETVQTFTIDNHTASEFKIPFTSNNVASYFIETRGVDASGYNFTRIALSPVEFVNIEISCQDIDGTILRPGETTKVTVSIRNHGNTEASIQLGIIDTQKYVTNGINPSTLTVPANGVVTATYDATVPSNTLIGTTSLVTISGKSSEVSFGLYKRCRLIVGERLRPIVESFNVNSVISSRFAETVMTSVVYNNASVSREAEFQVFIPNNAFITAFSMTLDNKTYEGTIEGTKEAENIYSAAKELHQTAAHIVSRDKSNNVFRTFVNLAPYKRVTFKLTYQELLKQSGNNYTYGVTAVTLQPIKNFSIDVSICESDEILDVYALGIDTEQTSIPEPIPVPAVSITKHGNTATISYRPTISDQTEFSPLGLNGRFIVKYALFRNSSSGKIVTSGSDFIHFASPKLEPMPKRVAFVLDVSGSMFGHKFFQLKLAMSSILDSLRPTDEFSIILFNNTAITWKPKQSSGILVPVNPTTIEMAKEFLDDTTTRGGTNILQGVLTGINLLKNAVRESSADNPLGDSKSSNVAADYVILLTDGQSTAGVVDPKRIESRIKEVNNGRFGIHTIGFGTLVDAGLLETIAAQNFGSFVQLFLDIDTSTQIVEFFNSISRPLLHNIELEYPNDKVSNSTKTSYTALYDGNELANVGEFLPGVLGFDELKVTLRGQARKSTEEFNETLPVQNISQVCKTPDSKKTNFVKRLHDVLKLQYLLKQISGANGSEKVRLKQQALNISLTQGFVTPGITSIVILKPEENKDNNDKPGPTFNETSTSPQTSPTPAPGTQKVLPGREVVVEEQTTPPPATQTSQIVGDPHLIVDLGEQITICFNWHGYNNEFYNMIQDDIAGITVNAKLVQVLGGNLNEAPTYIGEIGFVFLRKNLSATVDVDTLTINVGLDKPLHFSLSDSLSVSKRGIHFKITKISKALSSLVVVFNKKIIFKILSHTNSFSIKDHLDFSVVNGKGFSEDATGLLGQFPGKKKKEIDAASIYFIPNSNEALLSYKHNLVRVVQKSMFESYEKKYKECWFVPKIHELTGEKLEKYLLPTLLHRPKSILRK